MIAAALIAAAVPAGQVFACTPVLVWDGDGPIRCAEGPRVRLVAIAARELDGTCRAPQPCPRASGIAARDRLVRLLGGARGRTADGHVRVRGPALTCRSSGPDRYGRTVARCASARTGDLSCVLSRSGVVAAWPAYGPACIGERGRR